MPSRVAGYFVGAYRDSSLQIRKKSSILAYMALIFSLFSLAFFAVMAATGAVTVALVFVGILAFCLVVLALLKAGRYHLASSLFLYGLFAAMFVAIKFDAYQNVYETYVLGTLYCFLLVVATLVADRASQPIALAALSLGAIEALYWLDAYPLEGKLTTLAVQNLATPSLLLVLGGGVAAYLVSLNSKLVSELEERAAETSDSYDKLNAAMGAAHADSSSVGERLSAGVARGMEAITGLRAKVLGIAEGMDRLTSALGSSSAANEAAVAGQAEVRTALVAYSEEVAHASAAIEEMAASVGSLGSQAGGKMEAVATLVELSKAGEARLAATSASIDQILESVKRMAEMNVFIGDVADRTNLLGMNASIEAAHAGLAGKGFAVVADQIRSLSVEAGDSSRRISEGLRETQEAVNAASGRNREALDFFRKISSEIGGVCSLLEELLANLRELSAGSDDVLRAVGAVSELTSSTEKAVESSSASIASSSAGIGAVAEVAESVRRDSKAIAGGIEGLREEIAAVERLDGENLRTIEGLRKSLEGFSAAQAAQAVHPTPAK
jgi:methyl-accepting chemotaxis protein